MQIAWMALCLVLTTFTCGARTLQLEDYLALERVTAPQISPDGKTILYTRAHVNSREDRFDSELWIMDADGSRNRQLIEGGSDVHWSPDGSRIAYINATAQGSDVFVRWIDAAGNTSQITHGGMNPQSLSWSPDGRWIAFLAQVPASSDWNIALPARPAGAHWSDDAIVIDKLHYRLDHKGLETPGYVHIFVVSAQGGMAKQLTHGQWNAARVTGMPFFRGALEWTPDGKSLLFSSDRDSASETDYGHGSLYAVNLADGHLRLITRTWGYVSGPRVSPDGRQVAYVGTQISTTSNFPSLELHVIGIDGGQDRVLIDDLPGNVSYLKWADNGRMLYYVVQKEGTRNVHAVSLTGTAKLITSGARVIALSSVSKNGIAVGTEASAYRTPEVVRFNLDNGRDMRRLTATNDSVLSDVRLGRVEEIWYDSSDHTRVQGWIVYPPDFNESRKYPLILDVHGGPEGMFDDEFQFAHQDLAAHGYVVLYTNPRGSTGYGGAFARAIYNGFPGRADYEDLMNGLNTVVARGFTDAQRIYVQGCSGGGTLTAWAVTQTDRFAAAAAMCPIVNMISLAGATDLPDWAFNHFKMPFWEDPSAWLATSAIMRVNKVRTPTLVMVGENDIRTTVGQAEELYTGLKMVGVPTKLILFHDEWHGTDLHPSNMMRTQLYLRKWYGQWRRIEEDGKPVWREAAVD